MVFPVRFFNHIELNALEQMFKNAQDYGVTKGRFMNRLIEVYTGNSIEIDSQVFGWISNGGEELDVFNFKIKRSLHKKLAQMAGKRDLTKTAMLKAIMMHYGARPFNPYEMQAA